MLAGERFGVRQLDGFQGQRREGGIRLGRLGEQVQGLVERRAGFVAVAERGVGPGQ
jgi:hypothetical protein